MYIALFGTSHKTAPVDVREQVSFKNEEIPAFLDMLKGIEGVREAVLLSTCNRTEIIAVLDDGIAEDVLGEALISFKNISTNVIPKSSDVIPAKAGIQHSSKVLDSCLPSKLPAGRRGNDMMQNRPECFYTYTGTDAVRHIFRVAASLESQMIGENQIKNQVKDGYTAAVTAGTTGSYLNRLFHKVFKVAKAVRTETNLGNGAVSISKAAVEMAQYIFTDLSGKNLLLIGAGETGELVATHMLERGIGNLKICNRTFSKAQDIAEKYKGDAVDISELYRYFAESDIVISATASDGYMVEASLLRKYLNSSKKIVAIDIAVPRDIDPETGKLENIFLYDMDDLKLVVEKNLKDRASEIPHAEKIIEKGVTEYEKWLNEQKVVPTIKVLQERFEDIRSAEVQKNKHCGSCTKRHEVDALTKNIISKLLRVPISKLVDNTGCSEEDLKYLREMFVEDLNE